ncbi:SusC/RagA family TonB-linked outer membrane protein [uncultured Chitinophaga sp.]|uniref:SusC/RagA family TonB-linked outer membrane protein n=1 Tax=uncultured Chitinophaga sp. TaxID=339340 RepID=UPI0026291EC5|nr:SusC/RagA family TonB-linked outer membrane protein [uncultured Chitinophaga sp.]
MRKILLLFGVFCVVLHAYTYANAGADPEPKISINGTYTLKAIFGIIRTQTGKEVSYASTVLNDRQKVKVNLSDASVDEVLTTVLRGLNLSWKKTEQYITLYKQAEGKAGAVVPPPVADTVPVIVLTGTVRDTAGNPLPGASIQIQGTRKGTSADGTGSFRIADVGTNSIVQVGFTGYETKIVALTGSGILNVVLNVAVKDLQGVSVYSTGYQKVPKERATGSFVQVSNQLYNRSVGPNVLNRLEGVTSGVAFNKNGNLQQGQSSISIRGRSTILGNAEPLIVLDNFPFSGDINSLNPNDIESVTILRDAASASIWGTRAANGVIVISTKRGNANTRPTITFNANATVSEKPNIFYTPQMSSSEYVDAEKFLFSKGAYDIYLGFIPYLYSSDVINVLWEEKNGIISNDESARKIKEISNTDIRNDVSKYIYKPLVQQQYSIGISGGNNWNRYYYSFGYDGDNGQIVKNNSKRFTVNGKNSFVIIKDKVELSTGLIYSKTNNHSTSIPSSYKTPYGELKTSDGKNAVIPGNFRRAFTDTTGSGLFMNWDYRPLDDINDVDLNNNINEFIGNVDLKYSLLKNLSLQLLYQYSKGGSESSNYYSNNSYLARNLINSFSQVNNQDVIYQVPRGAIFDYAQTTHESNDFRANLTFVKNILKHSINVITGAEKRSNKILFAPNQRMYGYNKENESFVQIDYTKSYQQVTGGTAAIPNSSFGILRQQQIDNNISYFFNGSYNYDNRYTASVSVRKDESNIFGVNTNKKGVPLYSLGFAWAISNEDFYSVREVPSLKIRLTYGYNGNLDKRTTAYLTATSYINLFNNPSIFISSPPNPNLTWEKISMANVAIDFASINNRISGSIEYFKKHGINMIGVSPLAPSDGISQYRGNNANMKGSGIDLSLATINLNTSIKWVTNTLISYATDKVTKFKTKPGSVSSYMLYGLNPIEGNPVYSIYSYKWGGLDPLTGDPIGIVDGKPSKDYSAITGTNDNTTLRFHGSAIPTVNMSIRNTFTYKQVDLSFNITGKFGYFFRRNSLDYGSILNPAISLNFYNPDYGKRWKAPGDELITNVPSIVYPDNPSRSNLYSMSEINVEKGDHIRLQDIHLSYLLPTERIIRFVNELRLYAYINNVGLLWRSNKFGIDPDFIPGNFISYPNPRSYSLGVSVKFK